MVRHESIVTALIGAALGMAVGIFLAGLTSTALSKYGLVFALPYKSLAAFVVVPRPIFLIYTPHGQGAETLNPTFYAAAREPKTLWQIPEASHTGGLTARPKEYERRVIAFFDNALLKGK